ncbi:hypothetical protein LguiB_002690 [Lonicera macranthoides]
MLFFLQLSFFTLVLLCIFTLLLIKWLPSTQKTRKNLPPSPRKLPIIGNFHQLGSTPHRSLQSLAQKHGPLILLHLGRVPVLVASSSNAAQEIMKTHDLIFSNRPNSSVVNRLLYGSKDIAFCTYGEYWRQVRTIGVLHLLSTKRVQSYRRVREEEVALMVENIKEISNSLNQVVNLSETLVSLMNDVVCRVALGRKYGGESGRKFKELLREFMELLGAFCVRDYIPWFGWVDRVNGLDARVNRVANGFDEFLEGVVSEHMEKKKGKGNVEGEGEEEEDFVDILLEIQKEHTLGFPVHRDTIKALILDAFSAGTDTTTTLLEWAMAELLKHPQIMIKLQNEVRKIAKNKLNVTEDDLEKMQYLKLVIKETLRLHTPVPLLVPRESTQEVKILGYDVEAGTQVRINAWAIGRDPLLWEDPEEFRPERFLNSSIDFKGFNFELIPFGAGRRGCPGTLFAIAVNELALANLLYKFDIALPGGARAEDLDMAESIGILAQKKTPILVVATPYSH